MPLRGDPHLLGRVIHAGFRNVHKDADEWAAATIDDLKASISRPIVSRPYEPPGLHRGVLRASYQHRTRGRVVVLIDLFSTAEHAKYLEFGTYKMEPRPHLRPAVARNAPGLPRAIVAGVTARQVRAARGGA